MAPPTRIALGFNDEFQPGDRVRVVSGPFEGLSGIISRVVPERRLALIVVRIFGREAPIELPLIELERLTAP